MPANLQVVARRLKSIRATLGYDLPAVAEATGVHVDRIAELESGTATGVGDEVLVLAAFYDCDFRSILDDTLPEPDQKTNILFRRYGSTFSAQDRRAVQEFVLLCQIEQWLESELAHRTTSLSIQPRGRLHKDQGTAAAADLRRALGYSDIEVPRNVYEDFRKIGVHVFRRRLENAEISGLYLRDAIAGHCILINYNEDLYRQRFSAAHEMAHAIFDSSEEVSVTYLPHSGKYNKNELKEIRANAFAREYLLPTSVIRVVNITEPASAMEWAQRLRVSTSALANALQADGKSEGANIARTVRVPSSDRVDPEAPDSLTDAQRVRRLALLERGLSDHYVHLCFEALHRGAISMGRLMEALRIDPTELVELATLYGRHVQHDF
jgi:Zn-dependent peptidase ImmA (M78 family)/transcriptional regulator with XRE-family HTH domain